MVVLFTTVVSVSNAGGPTAIAFTQTDVLVAEQMEMNLGAVTGGTPPYTNKFKNRLGYSATTSYTGLAAGTYGIDVKDASGCIYSTSVTMINTVTYSYRSYQIDSTCGAANGSVTLGAVTGGTAPYTYNFNGLGFSAVTNYTGLSAGSYSIDVQDANGCIYYKCNYYNYNCSNSIN